MAPPRGSTDKLIDSLVDNEKETVRLLREIHSMVSTLQHALNRNQVALIGIIILLIVGVFALVGVKLQTPTFPLGP